MAVIYNNGILDKNVQSLYEPSVIFRHVAGVLMKRHLICIYTTCISSDKIKCIFLCILTQISKQT
jgi:uncharacterized membrane protein